MKGFLPESLLDLPGHGIGYADQRIPELCHPPHRLQRSSWHRCIGLPWRYLLEQFFNLDRINRYPREQRYKYGKGIHIVPGCLRPVPPLPPLHVIPLRCLSQRFYYHVFVILFGGQKGTVPDRKNRDVRVYAIFHPGMDPVCLDHRAHLDLDFDHHRDSGKPGDDKRQGRPGRRPYRAYGESSIWVWPPCSCPSSRPFDRPAGIAFRHIFFKVNGHAGLEPSLATLSSGGRFGIALFNKLLCGFNIFWVILT